MDKNIRKDNPEFSPEESRTIHYSKLNLLLVALCCALALWLIHSTGAIARQYNMVRQLTMNSQDMESAADDLMNASDYLTESVRAYVITKNMQYARDYCKEVELTRRRDIALERLGTAQSAEEAYKRLESALAESNRLVLTELKAMQLTALSSGGAISDLPGMASGGEKLTDKEMALSPEEQGTLAMELVFGPEYNETKNSIRTNVSDCIEELKGTVETQLNDNAQILEGLLQQQRILLMLMMCIVIAIVLMHQVLLLRPLEQIVKRIQTDSLLPDSGVYELRFLEHSYNNMLQRTQHHQSQLEYEASHDALTGILNRSALQKVLEETTGEETAFLLVDVDKFKGINDTYGHDTGDLVLKRVAGILQRSFRSVDYVCRMGGDEFAVVMVQMNAGLAYVAQRKVDQIMALLSAAKDIPPVTLSIGIAFRAPEETDTEAVYRKADKALYEIKNAGGCGAAFYKPDMELSDRGETDTDV